MPVARTADSLASLADVLAGSRSRLHARPGFHPAADAGVGIVVVCGMVRRHWLNDHPDEPLMKFVVMDAERLCASKPENAPFLLVSVAGSVHLHIKLRSVVNGPLFRRQRTRYARVWVCCGPVPATDSSIHIPGADGRGRPCGHRNLRTGAAISLYPVLISAHVVVRLSLIHISEPT